jgi:hypothetical protein
MLLFQRLVNEFSEGGERQFVEFNQHQAICAAGEALTGNNKYCVD